MPRDAGDGWRCATNRVHDTAGTNGCADLRRIWRCMSRLEIVVARKREYSGCVALSIFQNSPGQCCDARVSLLLLPCCCQSCEPADLVRRRRLQLLKWEVDKATRQCDEFSAFVLEKVDPPDGSPSQTSLGVICRLSSRDTDNLADHGSGAVGPMMQPESCRAR